LFCLSPLKKKRANAFVRKLYEIVTSNTGLCGFGEAEGVFVIYDEAVSWAIENSFVLDVSIRIYLNLYKGPQEHLFRFCQKQDI